CRQSGFVKPGARIFDRSTSFASVTLDPVKSKLSWRLRCKAEPLVSASPARTAKKLLRKKKNESWAMRRQEFGLTSPTLELEETCYAKSPIMFYFSRFDLCGSFTARAGQIDIAERRSIAGM